MTDANQQTLSGVGVDEQDTLDLDTLESHLWEAADILRGSIDAADYKNYIFGLLFLKRINDRFDEETEEIAEEYDIDKETVRGERDLHEEFWVPDRARWDHITSQTDNIGEALDKALIAVEDENDVIADRVLSTVDYNDKDRLSDATLDELVTHFSTHRYRNVDLEDPDIFGRAYEYLIRQFADDAGKKGGEFYTPREVVQLLVECVAPEPGDRVYDPCCGSGGMLIYSGQHVRDIGGDEDDISLYGQEKNLNTWAIGQMNVLLHEMQDAKIEKGDTITDPKFVTEHGELELFDVILANPQWNQKKWNKEWVQENEPYNRFPYGLPPSNRGDWAWIQLMVSSLSETGKAGVVMDNGVLFRSRTEGKIRKEIINTDLIETVIALPENLFYNTSSPGCILILNKNKSEAKSGNIQFIYAENKHGSKRAQNYLREKDIESIVDAYQNRERIEHFSRVVSIDEIEDNNYNLNVSRYIDTTGRNNTKPVPEIWAEITDIEREQDEITSELAESFEHFGYEI
ncbi:type I restriction-modification system DNA-methyltransferase RmeM [Haloferax gibbonsii]|uniref:site-specific DNA-methyltransferase (adenine-specific) n=1 Tax=Haloferax gibbonsii TaxID=35746 RepID=A0A871BC99_HALGI|nr:class I SAM-dependent DNA methyltransferase [Haloferax gibbonsii]QOS10429.1 type I restriction-modification system DNA-methyltransferase RmeM [Haloferax gibbonsii]